MGKNNGLRFGLLGDTCVHLCVDMQRIFAEDTPWKTPWMPRVLPKVYELVAAHPSRTVFTRFIPVERPDNAFGTWRRYYERWSSMTLACLGKEMVDILPEFQPFVPPAHLLDKQVHSPWYANDLHARLQAASIDTVVISGGETDVCVLSTVLGAVDRGYRVVLATDALCSSSDETHEASLAVYERRFSQQVEAVATEVILESWK